MPTDLDDKHAAQTVKPVGCDALGLETEFVQVDAVNGHRRLVGRSSIVSEGASPVAAGVTSGGRLMVDTVSGGADGIEKYTADGKGYSAVVEDANLTPANTYDPALYFRNPAGSGKTALVNVVVYAETSGTSARIIFHLSQNPTVTANGTAVAIANNLIGGAAGVCLVNKVPTVTARGTTIEENIVPASGASQARHHNFDLQVPAGASLLISGKATINNKTVTVSMKWVEV